MDTTDEANVAQYIQRLSDIDIEPLEKLMPIDGYEDMPLVPLDIALEPLVSSISGIHIYAYSAKERCKNPPANELTIDESASIMLYSMDSKFGNKSFHVILNETLKSADKNKLEPWLLYLKLFFTALSHLPSTRRQVYRGIKLDLSKEYPVGETIVWSGFSSCTTSINFVQSELFLGTTGPRTIFSITCYFGKDIGNHSYYSSENETVIFPPTQFKVIDCLNQGNGLHIIQLQEIQPCFSRLHAPVFSSISKKPSSSPKPDCLYFPYSVYVDDDQTIYIADHGNNHVIAWKYGATSGQLIASGNGSGFNGSGCETNQLNKPINVVVDRRRNHVFISDSGNMRVVRWPCENGTNGEVIISNISCRGLGIDNNGDLYVSDWKKNEVRRWKQGETEGAIVAGGNGWS
ncbi:unnamed protein product [Adineta steineri]|uniref:NAD(P)(+)--arginine ADP-ribosyltransferase n=1 Tax=Adineta steineri TaxID=433720 RepID=A0A814AU40_9BILA|nr:unnamed protein product [Adineta steineri]CAF0920167.1 unnamed protein product [Adineta steineri]